MRQELIEELIKEVHGPRNGAEEELPHGDPLKEYITGVIIPRGCKKMEEDPDSEITASRGEDLSADDDVSDENVLIFGPSELDPKTRPRSFGFSFVVEGMPPSFKICVTWGRYVRNREKEEGTWKRRPYYVIKQISVSSNMLRDTLYEGDDGKILLYIRKIERDGEDGNIIIVSMVNDLNIGIGKCFGKALTEASIFQPSIRIKMLDGTRLADFPSKGEQPLHFLYRNKQIRARGFMCSAIWKEIDYSHFIKLPVLWADGYHFGKCHEFAEADVRSEFVPLCPNPSPIFEWLADKSPQLSARKLSDMWERTEIEDYLSPIAVAYEKWIIEKEKEARDMKMEEGKTAAKLIDLQKETLERLKTGIEILKEDKEARLCFCFANRAIYLQHNWKYGGDDFKWRPFQLAFILMTLESVYNESSIYRNNIDLLWVATGGGKTEAYLAIIAFAMALRRRKTRRRSNGDRTGGGTAVITRYTLRLLTIQQFRRTLRMITAAEYLRITRSNKNIGWRPEKCDIDGDWIYGSIRFSAGMWVGSAVSPNHIRKKEGAIDALRGEIAEGEPAQVIKCPMCSAWLAVPKSGIPAGKNELYLVSRSKNDPEKIKELFPSHIGELDHLKEIDVSGKNHSDGYLTLKISLESGKKLTEKDIDDLWEKIKNLTSLEVASFRASRPGYFGCGREPGRLKEIPTDFEIYCPNPDCGLNNDLYYEEGVPRNPQNSEDTGFPDGLVPRRRDTPFISGSRIPITAYTIDEQIYHRCPTVLISTADKIARLAFESRAASIFGNVERYNAYYGYYRDGLFPEETTRKAESEYNIEVEPFSPPELIIQDELHLIDGPLGSMFGLYEIALGGLIERAGGHPKYIASTATTKNAAHQVKRLFARKLFQFPPYGLDVDDSFFIRNLKEIDGWNEENPGRIYMGIYAPGMGPHTPNVRIWSRLLKTCYDLKHDRAIKYFWTIVGYFNAIRELGGGRALYREDIIERLNYISHSKDQRLVDPENVVGLSSLVNSTDIPQILDELESEGNKNYDLSHDAIFTTSMFGTGIDVPHLSLMIVNGQPKTTSQYIQATGRVGRSHGGLIITFLRSGRPRDLSHYEMFPAYHHRLYLDVEPASVSPFSEGCLARASGPAMVSFLRNIANPSVKWYAKDGLIICEKDASKDLQEFLDRILQPRIKYIGERGEEKVDYFRTQQHRWSNIALGIKNSDDPILDFVEYTYKRPQKNVVLGDPHHEHSSNLKIVYKNAPQSLRDIEETTGFEV